MGKKKEIRIINTNDYRNEEYTFIKDANLNNIRKAKSNDGKSVNKSNEIVEKKIHLRKLKNKGRKILSKNMQGHSPIYEQLQYTSKMEQ